MFLVANFVFIYFILRKVNINYNAKSGAPSLQIEEVMINFCILVAILIFGSHFVFLVEIWSFKICS